MADDPNEATRNTMLASAEFKQALAELQQATSSLAIEILRAGDRYAGDPFALLDFHMKYMPQATRRVRAFAASIMAVVDQVREDEGKPGDGSGRNSGGDPETPGA